MNIKIYAKYLGVCISSLIVIFVFIFFFVMYPLKYKRTIKQYSSKYGIQSALIASIIKTESSFNKSAVSGAGAVGLMQIMPQTAIWVCKENNIDYNYNNLFQPNYNIMIGTIYLKYLQTKFNNQNTAICAYNAGEGVVKLWLKNPNYSKDQKTLNIIPYPETANYLKRVNTALKIYSVKI